MLESITTPIKNAFSKVKNAFGGTEDKPVFDDELVKMVNDEFVRRQQERRPHELQWRLNLAFYEGNQFLDINTATMALEEQPTMFNWQVKEAYNHIAPNIETRISKMKRIRPVCKVTPGTGEPADIRKAKISGMLLKNTYSDQEVKDKMEETYAWMETCGTVFWKQIWNPDIGQVIATDEEGNPIHEGDIEIIVVPPQEIYPDSSYRTNIKACKSIIHARAYHINDTKSIWGVDVKSEDASVQALQATMNGMGGLGYGQGGFMYSTAKLKDHAIVKEYNELPSKEYPEGRLIIVCSGTLLYAGPLPFQVGDDGTVGIPFTKLDCLKRPGMFWGKTVLERLIPVQRAYNSLRNRKTEYLNRAAIGQWAVEEGSVDDVDFEENAGAPGAIHVYQRGSQAPSMIRNEPLPNAFETEEPLLLQGFSILSGVSEISRSSQAPSGVKSGVALGIVQEQDDTRLSNTADNIERFIVQAGKMTLRLLKQHVKMPRALKKVGKNNMVEVIDWTGMDIHADDVEFDSIAANIDSPSQRRQMVFDLMESGLLLNPDTQRIDAETRSKILEMIEFGDWESADDTDQLHISKAERENKQMMEGSLPTARNFDNHILHISRHQKYRLTVDYEEMVTQNPQIDVMFEQMVNMHLAMMQQAVQQQMMEQAAMAGQGEQQQAV